VNVKIIKASPLIAKHDCPSCECEECNVCHKTVAGWHVTPVIGGGVECDDCYAKEGKLNP
jgi:hypothetical protein